MKTATIFHFIPLADDTENQQDVLIWTTERATREARAIAPELTEGLFCVDISLNVHVPNEMTLPAVFVRVKAKRK